MKDSREVLLSGRGKAGGVEAESLFELRHVGGAVDALGGGPVAAHRPRQHGLEGGEEVEDGDGHEGHVVGRHGARPEGLAEPDTYRTEDGMKGLRQEESLA